MKNLITNRQELIDYSKSENNSYTNYILSFLKQENYSKHNKTHKHPIIPLHMNGPNKKWNLVTLSIDEHSYAHKLLFENSKNYYDLSASYMLLGQRSEGFEKMCKANHLKMKQEGKGF